VYKSCCTLSKATAPKSTLAREAVQEGLEEQVNVFAEKEGRIKGKLLKEDSRSYLESFGKSAFSSEGALNFFLGAIGGVAQTGALNYLPYRNYTDVEGNTKRTSTNEIRQIQEEEKLKNYLSVLKDDISTIVTNQKDLQAAVEKGDVFDIDEARKKLFDVSVLKSVREGTADEFIEEMNQIASTDNTKVDEKGMTVNEFGRAANVPKTTIHRIMNSGTISLKNFGLITKFLNIKL